MSRTKLISAIGVFIAIALVATFTLRSTLRDRAAIVHPNSVKWPKGELHLEQDPWSGYITTRDAKFAAALKGLGYNYIQEQQLDQTVRANNMTRGNIDLMVTTLGQYLKHRPAGKVIGMIDESKGADALVLNTVDHKYLKSIDNLAQLVAECKKAGRKPVLAFSGDSPSEELLYGLANRYDQLRLSDFDLVPVDQSSTAYKMMTDHKADVVVIWEPDTTGAKGAGYTVALSSKNVPHLILDIIVASDRLIQNDQDAVQSFVTEFYKARAYNVAHPSQFEDAIVADATATGSPLSHDDAKSVLGGIYMFDATAADQFLNKLAYPLDKAPVFESVQAISGIQALTYPELKDQKISNTMWNGTFVSNALKALR